MIRTLPARLAAALVVAPSWAVAAALLVKGHAETGDGFSAGLTAGIGIVIHHLVFGREETRRLWVVRQAPRVLWAGLIVVLAAVFVPVLLGQAPLTHVPAPGGHPPALGTLELQSAFAFDLGVFAVVLGFALASLDLVSRFAARDMGEES